MKHENNMKTIFSNRLCVLFNTIPPKKGKKEKKKTKHITPYKLEVAYGTFKTVICSYDCTKMLYRANTLNAGQGINTVDCGS